MIGGGNPTTGRPYKFKWNMKHRFSNDINCTNATNPQNKKKRRDSRGDKVEVATKEEEKLPSLIPKEANNDEPSVPIFALNQKGSFYVPLTVDYSIVAPAMDDMEVTSPAIHPVSIQVNFTPKPTPSTMSNKNNSNEVRNKTCSQANNYSQEGQPEEGMPQKSEFLHYEGDVRDKNLFQYLERTQQQHHPSSRKMHLSSPVPPPQPPHLMDPSPQNNTHPPAPTMRPDQAQEAAMRNSFRSFLHRDSFREMAVRGLGAAANNPLLREYANHTSAFLPRGKYLPPNPWNGAGCYSSLGPSSYKD